MCEQDFTAKLSDFGLAKMGPEGEDTHVTTRVMGTHGYAAPEYVMTGILRLFSTIWQRHKANMVQGEKEIVLRL